jgi:hypothetical protein
MQFYLSNHDVLRWLHVIAMAYWLGGEWGVFSTARYVTDVRLPVEERRRHMDTAFRIDILARLGIILLLPLGLHMGFHLGTQPLGGWWLALMWIVSLAWMSLTLSAFFLHRSDLGLKLTRIDEGVRYVVIPALLLAGITSLFGTGPFSMRWYAAKVTLYAVLLIIGLALRTIMRHWVTLFRSLDSGTTVAAVEAQLGREIALARMLAYFYWAGIATVALFGVAKPI